MRPIAAVVSLLLAAVACQAPDTSAAAKTAIDASNANWARLSAAGHADSIAELYAADGVLMPPNMATFRGKEAVRAFFAELNAIKPTLSVRTEQVWGSGTMAFERGRWVFQWPAAVTRPPGVPPVDSGKYMARWEQQGGRWLMVEDIWNSDLPMPNAPASPPAPAARR
jgi:ketosteroid isomerase-like protein